MSQDSSGSEPCRWAGPSSGKNYCGRGGGGRGDHVGLGGMTVTCASGELGRGPTRTEGGGRFTGILGGPALGPGHWEWAEVPSCCRVRVAMETRCRRRLEKIAERCWDVLTVLPVAHCSKDHGTHRKGCGCRGRHERKVELCRGRCQEPSTV